MSYRILQGDVIDRLRELPDDFDAEAIKEESTSEPQTRDRNKEGYNPSLGSGRDRFSPGARTYGLTRNKRTVWEIATEPFPEAHFATFPKNLVEPCILAGTSEKGVCENCWAPWERMVSKSGGTTGKGWHDHAGDLVVGARIPGGFHTLVDYKVVTTGWKAGCDCETSDTVPSTILDPFNGSGTTGLVALANRCNYIGIELNPEYVAMAERRLEAATAQGVLL